MQETRTAKIAAGRLHAAGCEVTTGIGKTGVIGLLRNGKGTTVMLRADMDALPTKEDTGLPPRARRPVRIRGQQRHAQRTLLQPRYARDVLGRRSNAAGEKP